MALLLVLGAAACAPPAVRTFQRPPQATADPCPSGWRPLYTDWLAAGDGSRVVCRRAGT